MISKHHGSLFSYICDRWNNLSTDVQHLQERAPLRSGVQQLEKVGHICSSRLPLWEQMHICKSWAMWQHLEASARVCSSEQGETFGHIWNGAGGHI